MNLIEKLDDKNKRILEIIKNSAVQNGEKVFVVGGVVRDLILNKKIKDVDFLIEGSAIDFCKKSNFKIKSIHENFNTAKIEIEGEEIDVASTREETYPKAGCLPVVQNVGTEIKKDLKRRDFTINSIAINILTNEIIDPFCGISDIEKKILKILHDKSFIDDPTRILRGLDFKYRFNFEFDEKTEDLIKKCTENYDNSGLSIDRICLTLNKIFSSKNSDKILKDISDKEIYKIWTKKIGIKTEEIQKLEDTIKLFPEAKKNKLYLMALENCPYIKASFKDDFEIYEFFKKFNNEQLAFYYFKTEDKSAVKFLEIKEIKPLITGKTLIEKGFCEGEIIGTVLNSILKEKILNKNSLNTVQSEIDFALKNFKF